MAKRKNSVLGIQPLSRDMAALVLRVSSGGLMMMQHGYPKLMKLSGNGPIKFGDPLGIGEFNSLLLAIFSEFLCSALLILGLFTRLALIPLIITMLVILFVVHAGDPIGDIELAVMYAVIFVALLFSGPGKWSVDALIKK
ncbi:MAG: DoxX family protein [Saprospiraceae bacterium]|nr:DoxX family protein [Saprospiraceae bacterium]